MRGQYRRDEIESPEDRNARENAAKQAAGLGPQIIIGPDTPAGPEDLRAIVRAVAMAEFLSHLDYHGVDELSEYHPALEGLTEEQIRAVITEDLS